MNKGAWAVAAAVLLVSGCSDKAAAPPRGALPPGTATLSVDGRNVGTTYSVSCQTIDTITRIHTDLGAQKVSAMLSNAEKLRAEFVRFRGVDGFTGSYEQARQGEAAVTMTGPTYHITGAAVGFNDAERTRVKAETFTVNVSC